MSARKGLTLTVLTCLAAAIAACGSSDSADKSGATTAATAATAGKHIEIVVPDPVGAYYQMACGARQEGRRLGFDVSEPQAPKSFNSAADVTQALRGVLAKNPDGLLYGPADPVASGVALKQPVANGLPVALLGTKLADSSLYVSLVGADMAQGGVVGGKLLADQIGGSGQVAAIGVIPDHPITIGRIKGFREAMKQSPSIDVVDVHYSAIDVNKIAADAAAMLTRYPNLKGIYTTNDLVASGVGQALRAAGKVGKVKMITWDLNDAGVKLLEDGVATGTVVEPVREVGAMAMRQLAAKLEGKPVKKEVLLPSYTITSTDINTPKVKAAYYSADCA